MSHTFAQFKPLCVIQVSVCVFQLLDSRSMFDTRYFRVQFSHAAENVSFCFL